MKGRMTVAATLLFDQRPVTHGIALFERIRYRRFDSSVFMYAFDLIELNGDDLGACLFSCCGS
jgi:hypothetical protein